MLLEAELYFLCRLSLAEPLIVCPDALDTQVCDSIESADHTVDKVFCVLYVTVHPAPSVAEILRQVSPDCVKVQVHPVGIF